MPSDRVIVFSIHQNPQNASSPVVFVAKLEVHATSINGNTINWTITKATYLQPQGGGTSRRWVKNLPTVPGGYWTITHADANNPQLSEFMMPPQLDGTATAQDTGYNDLLYDLVGSSSFGSSPFSPAAGLTYEFRRVGVSEPEEEGDDEPVDPIEEDP